MKKLTVTMTLEMTVPDDWEVVTTSEQTEVVRMSDGRYLDLTFEPLVASDPEETWESTGDDDLLDALVGMVDAEEVLYGLEKIS